MAAANTCSLKPFAMTPRRWSATTATSSCTALTMPASARSRCGGCCFGLRYESMNLGVVTSFTSVSQALLDFKTRIKKVQTEEA